MDAWSGWVRNVVLGRKRGIRAAIRKRLNVATWLDEEPAPVAVPDQRATADDRGWLRIASTADLPREGELFEVFADDRALVVARVNGEVYVLDSVCPHAGGPLGEGQLDQTTLTCPWHGWPFDIRTGVCGVDTSSRIETFAVRIDGDDVFVASRSDAD